MEGGVRGQFFLLIQRYNHIHVMMYALSKTAVPLKSLVKSTLIASQWGKTSLFSDHTDDASCRPSARWMAVMSAFSREKIGGGGGGD